MKKLNLFFIILFASTAFVWENESSNASRLPIEDPIELSEVIIQPKPGPKLPALIPISACYDQESSAIHLETDGQQGQLFVSVENLSGSVSIQQFVDGNQSIIKVPLQSLPNDYYKLTIMSSTRCFMGTFEVY